MPGLVISQMDWDKANKTEINMKSVDLVYLVKLSNIPDRQSWISKYKKTQSQSTLHLQPTWGFHTDNLVAKYIWSSHYWFVWV